MTNTVLVSGGFDPLHAGHVELIESARQYGEVIIALNSDAWLVRKKGYAFMTWDERAKILKSLKGVVGVLPFNDDDGSAADAIRSSHPHIFAKGGDRSLVTLPVNEVVACEQSGVRILCGLGGKIQSSSELVQQAMLKHRQYSAFTRMIIHRPWGYYEELWRSKDGQLVLKRIFIARGEAISLQHHDHRDEQWLFVEGSATVFVDGVSSLANSGSIFTVRARQQHRITAGASDVMLMELQVATNATPLSESDIVRFADKYGRVQP